MTYARRALIGVDATAVVSRILEADEIDWSGEPDDSVPTDFGVKHYYYCIYVNPDPEEMDEQLCQGFSVYVKSLISPWSEAHDGHRDPYGLGHESKVAREALANDEIEEDDVSAVVEVTPITKRQYDNFMEQRRIARGLRAD